MSEVISDCIVLAKDGVVTLYKVQNMDSFTDKKVLTPVFHTRKEDATAIGRAFIKAGDMVGTSV